MLQTSLCLSQSASHSFSVLAPRDGVMTYPIIEVLRESNSSCGCYATVLPLHQSTIYREKGVRSPVCLRASLVPIFYHTLTVYSLSRETVIQGPLVIGDCYLGIIRIQTITYPSSVFLLYANHGFYTPHTNLTSSSHTTQPVSTGFSEWTSFYITTLYARLALALWRTRLPSTR